MRFLDPLLYELTPEHGVGYGLGILGAGLMLLLLLYPLKKRSMRFPLPFSTRFWFRVHMSFGVIGPMVIAVHSKLNMGSINSTMAFAFMTTVMVSGIVGRYLYRQIHIGLCDRRKTLEELLALVDKKIENIGCSDEAGESLVRKVDALKGQVPVQGSVWELIKQRKKIKNYIRSLLSHKSR